MEKGAPCRSGGLLGASQGQFLFARTARGRDSDGRDGQTPSAEGVRLATSCRRLRCFIPSPHGAKDRIDKRAIGAIGPIMDTVDLHPPVQVQFNPRLG